MGVGGTAPFAAEALRSLPSLLLAPSSLGPCFALARDGAVVLFQNALEPQTPAVPEQSRTSGQRVGSRIEAFQAFPAYMGPASLCHPLAGLMWTLALGGVFLATAQACVLCHLSDRDLSGRLARLCNQVKARWETCEASWTFPAFALGRIRHPGPGLAACGFPAEPLGHHLSPQPWESQERVTGPCLSPQMRCPRTKS